MRDDLLDARRLQAREPGRADGGGNLVGIGVAHVVPGREARPQLLVGASAVRARGVLAEDGLDQLGQGLQVRRPVGDAEDFTQARLDLGYVGRHGHHRYTKSR